MKNTRKLSFQKEELNRFQQNHNQLDKVIESIKHYNNKQKHSHSKSEYEKLINRSVSPTNKNIDKVPKCQQSLSPQPIRKESAQQPTQNLANANSSFMSNPNKDNFNIKFVRDLMNLNFQKPNNSNSKNASISLEAFQGFQVLNKPSNHIEKYQNVKKNKSLTPDKNKYNINFSTKQPIEQTRLANSRTLIPKAGQIQSYMPGRSSKKGSRYNQNQPSQNKFNQKLVSSGSYKNDKKQNISGVNTGGNPNSYVGVSKRKNANVNAMLSNIELTTPLKNNKSNFGGQGSTSQGFFLKERPKDPQVYQSSDMRNSQKTHACSQYPIPDQQQRHIKSEHGLHKMSRSKILNKSNEYSPDSNNNPLCNQIDQEYEKSMKILNQDFTDKNFQKVFKNQLLSQLNMHYATTKPTKDSFELSPVLKDLSPVRSNRDNNDLDNMKLEEYFPIYKTYDSPSNTRKSGFQSNEEFRKNLKQFNSANQNFADSNDIRKQLMNSDMIPDQTSPQKQQALYKFPVGGSAGCKDQQLDFLEREEFDKDEYKKVKGDFRGAIRLNKIDDIESSLESISLIKIDLPEDLQARQKQNDVNKNNYIRIVEKEQNDNYGWSSEKKNGGADMDRSKSEQNILGVCEDQFGANDNVRIDKKSNHQKINEDVKKRKSASVSIDICLTTDLREKSFIDLSNDNNKRYNGDYKMGSKFDLGDKHTKFYNIYEPFKQRKYESCKKNWMKNMLEFKKKFIDNNGSDLDEWRENFQGVNRRLMDDCIRYSSNDKTEFKKGSMNESLYKSDGYFGSNDRNRRKSKDSHKNKFFDDENTAKNNKNHYQTTSSIKNSKMTVFNVKIPKNALTNKNLSFGLKTTDKDQALKTIPTNNSNNKASDEISSMNFNSCTYPTRVNNLIIEKNPIKGKNMIYHHRYYNSIDAKATTNNKPMTLPKSSSGNLFQNSQNSNQQQDIKIQLNKNRDNIKKEYIRMFYNNNRQDQNKAIHKKYQSLANKKGEVACVSDNKNTGMKNFYDFRGKIDSSNGRDRQKSQHQVKSLEDGFGQYTVSFNRRNTAGTKVSSGSGGDNKKLKFFNNSNNRLFNKIAKNVVDSGK